MDPAYIESVLRDNKWTYVRQAGYSTPSPPGRTLQIRRTQSHPSVIDRNPMEHHYRIHDDLPRAPRAGVRMKTTLKIVSCLPGASTSGEQMKSELKVPGGIPRDRTVLQMKSPLKIMGVKHVDFAIPRIVITPPKKEKESTSEDTVESSGYLPGGEGMDYLRVPEERRGRSRTKRNNDCGLKNEKVYSCLLRRRGNSALNRTSSNPNPLCCIDCFASSMTSLTNLFSCFKQGSDDNSPTSSIEIV